MNKYAKILNKIFALGRFSPRKDLSVMKQLCTLLKAPQNKFLAIHVAGSNGKGSVCYKIAKALSLAGFKSALYTSPHILDFEERIMIDDEKISKNEVIDEGEALFKLIENRVTPTFFEFTTALAFNYFANKGVEFAVIETGLGGKLDATNVIMPELSVITSISLEHTYVLGNTIEEIAFQKGGIIKKGRPVILGPRADCLALSQLAKKNDSQLINVRGEFEFFDDENSSTAKSALLLLQKKFSRISNKAINAGIKERPACRFQCFSPKGSSKYPKSVIFDVAHNEAAFSCLFKSIKSKFKDTPIRVLFGLSRDKNIEKCTFEISKATSHVHLVEATSERAAPIKELQRAFLKHDYFNLSLEKNVEDGFKNAFIAASNKGELLLICGSFFIMKDALSNFET